MTAGNAVNLRCTYLLPIHRAFARREEDASFTEYFRKLAAPLLHPPRDEAP